MTGIIISLVVFISYLSYIYFKYGIQRSISDSYYRLTDAGKWAFTISTWGYVLPLILAGVSGNWWQDIILTCSGSLLLFVGMFPDFKITAEKKWHTIGAEGGIMVGMLWCISIGQFFIVLPSIIATAILFKLKPKNHTGWIEIISYFSIVVSMLVHQLFR